MPLDAIGAAGESGAHPAFPVHARLSARLAGAPPGAMLTPYALGGSHHRSEAQILADFPSLTSESIRAVLSFAAARERRLLPVAL